MADPTPLATALEALEARYQGAPPPVDERGGLSEAELALDAELTKAEATHRYVPPVPVSDAPSNLSAGIIISVLFTAVLIGFLWFVMRGCSEHRVVRDPVSFVGEA